MGQVDVSAALAQGSFAVLSLLFVGAAAWWVGWLRIERRVEAPYTRKIFHFVIFTAAGATHLWKGLGELIVFGSIVSCFVLYAVRRGAGFPFYEALARPSDAPRRSLFVLIPLATTAVGGLVSSLLFGSFAFVGILVAGWGDAIAEPIGTAWGRHRYRVPSLGGVAATRTLEGSAAVLLVGGLAATIGLTLAGVAMPAALWVGLACGLTGAALEAISHHGLDNLTVQIVASATAWLLLG
jgi:phytol kinase